jgi:hypothetical protein
MLGNPGRSCFLVAAKACVCKYACSDDNSERLGRIKNQKRVQTINAIGGGKSPYKPFLGFYSYFKTR